MLLPVLSWLKAKAQSSKKETRRFEQLKRLRREERERADNWSQGRVNCHNVEVNTAKQMIEIANHKLNPQSSFCHNMQGAMNSFFSSNETVCDDKEENTGP